MQKENLEDFKEVNQERISSSSLVESIIYDSNNKNVHSTNGFNYSSKLEVISPVITEAEKRVSFWNSCLGFKAKNRKGNKKPKYILPIKSLTKEDIRENKKDKELNQQFEGEKLYNSKRAFLKRVKLLKTLGEGTFGKVKLGKDSRSQKKVFYSEVVLLSNLISLLGCCKIY
jgi:hypothetical protein